MQEYYKIRAINIGKVITLYAYVFVECETTSTTSYNTRLDNHKVDCQTLFSFEAK